MSQTSTLELPTAILDSARLSLPELKIEIALALYAQKRLSIGKARELADLALWEFRQLLAVRGIAVHYDETDLADDIANLQALGRL